jgi:HPt (histidine-containing phosphotransfer) domain-containing protein
VPGEVADCHQERVAALVAALGPVRLAALVAHFRADLAGLAAAADGLDSAALQRWAHRLHGSGSTLGFDAAAAVLAGLATGAAGGSPAAVQAALAEAGEALARGEQALAAAVPGLAAEAAAAQEPDTSKR